MERGSAVDGRKKERSWADRERKRNRGQEEEEEPECGAREAAE